MKRFLLLLCIFGSFFTSCQDDTTKPDLLGVINGSTMTISNPTITSGSQVIYTLYKK